MRTDVPTAYPAYFKSHPEYTIFAEQAARTVEVPNVPNSVEIWQTFRDAYSQAVIVGSLPSDSWLVANLGKIPRGRAVLAAQVSTTPWSRTSRPSTRLDDLYEHPGCDGGPGGHPACVAADGVSCQVIPADDPGLRAAKG